MKRNVYPRKYTSPIVSAIFGMWQAVHMLPGTDHLRLRRLRLHGLTERIPKSHRYRITPKGLRTAIFYTGLYNRSLRTGLAIISPRAANPELPMAKSIRAAETAVNKWYQHAKLAA